MSKLDRGMPFPNSYTIFINGHDVRDRGAVAESFKVGAPVITNSIYQGRNRTGFAELAYTVGMRPISFNLFFTAETRRELAMNKSAIDAELIGKVEIHLPDGFYYTAALQTMGELQMLGVEGNQLIALCSYSLNGIRHDPLQTAAGNLVYADGTAPRMDCILSCRASKAYKELQVGPVVFKNIKTGDALTADGINGRLLINGTPAAQRTSFSRLPYLVPGWQTIDCPETVTVQYYPIWV